MRPASRDRVVRIFVGVATAVLIVAVAVLPFLTPAWLAFAQEPS